MYICKRFAALFLMLFVVCFSTSHVLAAEPNQMLPYPPIDSSTQLVQPYGKEPPTSGDNTVWNLSSGSYKSTFGVSNAVYTEVFFSDHNGTITVTLDNISLATGAKESTVNVMVGYRNFLNFPTGVQSEKVTLRADDKKTITFSGLSEGTKYYVGITNPTEAVSGNITVS